MSDAPTPARGVRPPRVLYLQYTNPAAYPPLEHSSRILADAGWDVHFLGARGADVGGFSLPPRPNVTVRLVDATGVGARQKLNYAVFVLLALWTAARWRPDVVYASDVFSAPAAILLMHLLGRRILYHEHDWPAVERPSRFLRSCLAARRKLVREAHLCVAPNSERARWLAEEVGGGREVLVAWNCPAAAEVEPAREAFAAPLRVLYQGSLNSLRFPLALVEALPSAPAVELWAVGYETVGSRGYAAEVMRTAERLGVGDRVRVFPPVSRSELSVLREMCHLGWAGVPDRADDRNLRSMPGASNKVFEYMAAGICPIVSDLPEWRPDFLIPGYALACAPDDASAITALLARCAADPDECWMIGERGRRRVASEWNYERQFRTVLDSLSALTAGRR